MNEANFYNEVLSMLSEGKTMTEIAQAITDAMNKAQNDHAEARKAQLIKENKMVLISKIYDLVEEYMTTYAADIKPADTASREEGITQVYDAMEQFISLMREATKTNTNSKNETKPKAPESKLVFKTIVPKSADEAINDFLKELGY